RWGFWYGVAAQGLVLYWLTVALWHFTPLSALGYLATIAIHGLWSAALFWFVTRVRLALPAVPLWAAFPVAWTAMEWVLGHQGDIRFPWLGLGTSLAEAPVLVQWADLAGARGVSLWVAWCNVLLVEAALGRSDGRTVLLRRLLPLGATVALALGYGAWRMRTVPVREVGVVGLIQPNEGFREKWDRAHADSVVAKLVALSGRVRELAQPDLIIWPEAAIPGYLFQQRAWDAAIGALARESRTPILTGGLHAEFHADGSYDYFNAAFFYDSTGDWRRHPVYGKHYLVPIVERVPFVPPRWFDLRWFGGFSRGRELPVYETTLGGFGVLVCYESAFEDLARRYRQRGADFLVNITNDAWFGRSAAPAQHLAMAAFRAVENRAYLIRAANTGISAIVTPDGRIVQASGLFTPAVISGAIFPHVGASFYTRYGDLFAWGTVGIVLVTAIGALAPIVLLSWSAPRGGMPARGGSSSRPP
ncbi:MAG: apolipoprotein N-acyltransferase, partial [Candidatus Entotheonellia bacterium]